MISKTWDSATYPKPLAPDTEISPKKPPSCDFLPCVDHNTGELTTVGGWALSVSLSAKGGLSSLEQVHAIGCNAPNRPFLKAVNRVTKTIIFFRPRCKMWSCPSCAKANSDMWIMRTVHATDQFLAAGSGMTFVTVTSNEKLTASQSLYVLPLAWKKLSMRWRRKVGSNPYIVIPERHQDGRVHIHGVMMSDVGTRWWKDNARSCGMGWRNEESTIQSSFYAGFYVGKYLSKQLKTHKYAKGFRRVRTSFHYPKQPDLPRSPNWSFEQIAAGFSVHDDAQYLQQKGFKVVMADHRTAWALVDRFGDSSDNEPIASLAKD